MQLEAVVYLDNGQIDENASVAWTSSEPSVVQVSPDGLAVAKTDVGYVTVTASFGSLEPRSVTVAVAKPAANTVIVDDQSVISVEADGTTAVLSKNSATTDLKLGDIVVSNVGILSRVTNITITDTVTLALEPVTLAEAFDKVRIRGSGEPIEYQALFTEDGVRITSSDERLVSRGITPAGISFVGVPCENTSGAPVDVEVTAGEIEVRFAPQPVFDYWHDESRLINVLEMYVKDTPEVDVTALTLKAALGGELAFECQAPFTLPLEIPVASFWGLITVFGTIDPAIGFQGSLRADVASLEVKTPSYAGQFETRLGLEWNPIPVPKPIFESRVIEWEQIEGWNFDVDNAFSSGLPIDISVGPFISSKAGFKIRVLSANAVGVDLIDPKVLLNGNLSLPSLLAPQPQYQREYEGTFAGLELAGALDISLDLNGKVAEFFKNFFGIENSVKIGSLTFLDFSFPLTTEVEVAASDTQVEDSVTLSIIVPRKHAGEQVEFVAFEGSDSAGVVIAGAVVDSSGNASGVWRPSPDIIGTYRVRALLYDNFLGLLNRPLASENFVELRLEGATPLVISGDIGGLSDEGWRATLLYPTLLANPSTVYQIGGSAPVASNGDFSLDISAITPPTNDSRVRLVGFQSPGPNVVVDPADIQGAEFSLIAFDDANDDGKLGSGETFYLLNDNANTLVSRKPLSLQYGDRPFSMLGTSETSTGKLVDWRVESSGGWGRFLFEDTAEKVAVGFSNTLHDLSLSLGATGSVDHLQLRASGRFMPLVFPPQSEGVRW